MDQEPVIEAEVRHYARTFTSEVVTQERLSARSVTLSYFAHDIARQLGTTPTELRRYLRGEPYLSSLMETSIGNAAVVVLPMTFVELIRKPDLTKQYTQAALEFALAMGARHMSLAGLLASALRYGELLDVEDGVLTTGHATTAASILKTVEAVLAACGREWQSEQVAVLGVGSIGQATASAALALLGPPRRLVLADLVARQDEVLRFVEGLRAQHPGLDVSFVDARQRQDNPLYERGLVVGATSTPGVLPVDCLQPGTMVVDDSVPHCFDVRRAQARIAASGDVVLANGGTLRFASAFDSHAFAPPLFHTGLDWQIGRRRVRDITSCTLSPLLIQQDTALAPTLGQGADAAAVLANYGALDRLSITAPPLRSSGQSPSAAYLARFAEQFA